MFAAFLEIEQSKPDDSTSHDAPEMTMFNQELFQNGAKPPEAPKFNFQLPVNDTPSLFGNNSKSDSPFEQKSEPPAAQPMIPTFGSNSLIEDDQNNQDDEAVMSLLNLFNSDAARARFRATDTTKGSESG